MALVEVHNPARPGRPKLLLFLCAGALVSALVLAWLQVQQTLSLGPPLTLVETPLTIRAPRGWAQEPTDPRTFHPAPKERRSSGLSDVLERRVRFIYERGPGFIAPERLVEREWNRTLAELPGALPQVLRERQPRKIGGMPAVQYHRVIPVQQREGVVTFETIMRVACTPRGDMIGVEYWPLLEASLADLELLDRICDAIRVDGLTSQLSSLELQKRVGLRFPIARDWMLFGPGQEGDAELSILVSYDDLPRWAVSLYRTWLLPPRTPQDLLRDFGLRYWALPLDESERMIQLSSRRDGATLAALSPTGNRSLGQPLAVMVVSKSPEETALVIVHGDSENRAVAQQAALDLAREMTFEKPDLGWDMAAALDNGVELAKLLTASGATPWWGRTPAPAYYDGRVGSTRAVWLSRADALTPDAQSGYRGFRGFLTDDGSFMLESWSLGPRGVDYELSREFGREKSGPQPPFRTISESRETSGGAVRRTIRDSRQNTVNSTMPVSERFVSPPMESVAEAWVAGRESGAWIIEVSNIEGCGLSTRLLRSLPRDGKGRARLAIYEDYAPRSRVVAIDDDGEAAYVPVDGGEFTRVQPNQLADTGPLFKRLIALLRD